MTILRPLLPSLTYHIYNHANGGDDLFRAPDNYDYFIRKWKKYIIPIAETHAYCLMPNHFHALVRIRSGELLAATMIKKGKLTNLEGLPVNIKTYDVETISSIIESLPTNLQGLVDIDDLSSYISQQFSNLFNGYTKAINKLYRRFGGLFNPRFKRKLINAHSYYCNTLVYIHLNPVLHRFAVHFEEWPFSSIHQYLSEDSWIDRTILKEIDIRSFRELHESMRPEIQERLSDGLE